MVTVKEVITDALEDINEQSAEEPIEAPDGNAAMRYLNDMMSMWAARGINLGFTRVSDFGDTVTVAFGAIAGIKAHLSIFLAAKFSAELHPGVVERAKEGWAAILNLAVGPVERSYPSILPMGSGNWAQRFTPYRFFPEADPAILAETGGIVALELDTTGV